jgi:hypothetical protein
MFALLSIVPLSDAGTALLTILISTRPLDPNEALLHLGGWTYVFVALFYSALVFWGDVLDRLPYRDPITGVIKWSGSSSIPRFHSNKPVAQVFLLHCIYLLSFLCCLRITTNYLSFFPRWLTDTFDVGRGDEWSLLDIGLFMLGIALAFIERVNLSSGTDPRHADDDNKGF